MTLVQRLGVVLMICAVLPLEARDSFRLVGFIFGALAFIVGDFAAEEAR